MTTQVLISLEAQERMHFGQKNKALRRNGFTPLHVYGLGGESLSLQAIEHDVALTIASAGRTAPLTLLVNGQEIFVVLREIQRHPVTDALLHVDLLRISRTEKLRVQVPVQLQGEAPAARADGRTLSNEIHEVEVDALPLDIPSVLYVDISGMVSPNAAIQLKDLPLSSGVALTASLDSIVVRIVARRGTSIEIGEPDIVEAEAPTSSEDQAAVDEAPLAEEDEAPAENED